MSDLCLGLDVGTSGIKAILVEADGSVRAVAHTEHAPETPRPQWSEQDPETWWRGAAEATRRVLDEAGVDGTAVAAVGLTGQMHGLVALDGEDRAVRPAMLWNDQRTARQCAAIHEQMGGGDADAGAARMIELTGKPALASFTAPKLWWVREHEPDVYARIARIMLPKDLVRRRLTGAHATDVADASGTSLLDLEKRRWSGELLEELGVPLSWLPKVLEGPAISGVVSSEGASATGLRAGTPVTAGGGDQSAEAVGCGVVEPGTVSVAVGTSGVVFAATGEPVRDPAGRLHAYGHALPGRWHVMGVMLSAAGSLRWWRETLGPAVGGYDELLTMAGTVPPGARGLVFLPYLSGERCPHPDPDARGTFVGLTTRHGLPEMTRAVLEGVAFGLRDLLDLVVEIGLPVERLRVSGGGVKGDLWRRIIADALGRPIHPVQVTEGAAYGAAVLATVGAGWHPDVPSAAKSMVAERPPTDPGPDAGRLAEVRSVHRNLYPALREFFPVLTGLDG